MATLLCWCSQSANHWAMSFMVLGSLPMLLSPSYRGPGGSVRLQLQSSYVTELWCNPDPLILFVFNT